ncbi:MAG: hypothetical protein LBK72_04865 [Bifidobacteriaceae bacterium]|jgi:hypothetical protein|nr:hypothetical protein [Bifidobacteriaceae bacterium]
MPDDGDGDWSLYERHFTAARLVAYLAECGGDDVRARRLYVWNASVASAMFESIGHVEVALRNALDARMTGRHLRKDRPGHWLWDSAGELGRSATDRHRPPFTEVNAAMDRVRRSGRVVSSDRVVSELPLGFWHQLVSNRQRFLWPDLAGGFPYAPTRNQADVRDRVGALRLVRNRAGHHHRVWGLDLPAQYAGLLALAGFMDPGLAQWIDDHSRLPELLTVRP